VTSLTPGVGLAGDYWKRYYDAGEVEQVLAAISHTTIVSQRIPVHVRAYLQDGPAPTMVIAHGILPYGLMFARLHLLFHGAGFNVVNFDIPGYGLSGGTRGGFTMPELIECWKDVVAWTHGELGDPLYVVGTAEDGVTAYYALANDARVRAMSIHVLLEYGDPANLFFMGGPRKVRMLQAVVPTLSKIAPWKRYEVHETMPFESIFDEEMVEVFEHDPLRITHWTIGTGATMAKARKPPVPFEQCRTPVQVLVSERSLLWPPETSIRNFGRLGGPKELVVMAGEKQWSFSQRFAERYGGHAIEWFRANGADAAPVERADPVRATG
jgi:pimeloyl-ACP methyl ester carboxylesterase